MCPRYSLRLMMSLTVPYLHLYGSLKVLLLFCSGWYFAVYADGMRTLSASSVLAISDIGVPTEAMSKIRLTTLDATGSTTSFCLSSGSLLYPYGMLPEHLRPSLILELNTAFILLLVSFAYHSFMIFRNGVKSLSTGLSLSILLLIAMNLTFF